VGGSSLRGGEGRALPLSSYAFFLTTNILAKLENAQRGGSDTTDVIERYIVFVLAHTQSDLKL
jgi:hypothetical protein